MSGMRCNNLNIEVGRLGNRECLHNWLRFIRQHVTKLGLRDFFMHQTWGRETWNFLKLGHGIDRTSSWDFEIQALLQLGLVEFSVFFLGGNHCGKLG